MRQLRQKWRQYLVGETLSQEAMQKIQTYRSTMQPDQTLLWPDIPLKDNTADSYLLILRLRELAIGVSTPGAACYNDPALKSEIRAGLEWFYEHRYNEVRPPHGNWWNWEIGVPITLLETIIVLEELDVLDPAFIERLLRPVDKYVADPAYHAKLFTQPNPSTGANLVWKVTGSALTAVVQGDEAKLRAACRALLPVFSYSRHGDGFYEDGSFIQHEQFAYTGGYGKSLLQDLTRVLVWLNGTPWELPANATALTCRWIQDSYVPLMFRGMLLDMASGREMSRHHSQNHDIGHIVITSCLRFARMLDEAQAEWLLARVKRWIVADTYKSYVTTAPPDTAEQARRLLLEERIQPAPEEAFCKLFAQMDRAVLQGSGFAFGISMYSDRIFTYESINGDNLKGWYTSQGMTSLYNGDLSQFADGYWPTVNPYRLPGITAAVEPLEDGERRSRSSSRSFVGGAVLGARYGAVAMELETPAPGPGERASAQLSGRKSWFLFGDRIVALGSNIVVNESGKMAETVIENRKLVTGEEKISADGRPICLETGSAETLQPRWIHLAGGVPEADAGIVFPKACTVKALREERSGSWKDINLAGPAEQIHRPYATFWFEHAAEEQAEQAASGAEYAYMVLPGRTEQETAEFAERSPIRIVEQSEQCHAVEDAEQGLFAAHFWQSACHGCGAVKVDGPASVVVKQSAAGWRLAVSDPTQKRQSPIELALDLPAGRVVYRSERIRLLTEGEGPIRLVFDPAGAAGGSFEIELAFESE